ncbi:COG4315 family predicted lipoprotein [Vogesella oryzae]|uniref:COG4315 family predicted lipoprotein n=1 Tax=Vogesella oryzae TaxID=1735285 RepID=UPI001FE68358|nr:hypothetical protein [Vogesella oryzae]
MSRNTLLFLLVLGALGGCSAYGHHGYMHDDDDMGKGPMMGNQSGMMGNQGAMMGNQMMGPAMFHQGVLAAMGGRTLYRFDKDSAGSGSSVCNGDCAVKWPPYLAAPGAQPHDDFAIINRADGSKQWSYKGWPLYFWQGDKQAGDMMGDNIGGVWHVIKP